jgi:hypothetical protein
MPGIIAAALLDIRSAQAQHRRVSSHAARYDRLTARVAELHAIKSRLSDAASLLEQGWVQDRWRDREGACLVGAIRTGGRGQLTERSLDLLWHALHDDPRDLRWVPPPEVRLARVRDLTRWNDRAGRRVEEVLALLGAADRLAAAEADRLRAELGLVAPRSRPAPVSRPAPARS